MRKRYLIEYGATIFIGLCIALLLVFYIHDIRRSDLQIGKELDSYKGVAVYYNGINGSQSHGKSYSDSGYYYGYKWQCVEYIKRFYDQAKGHEMPDVFGNAKDFYDPSVGQGQLNKSRGLIQYNNGGDVAPKSDDLLVFNDTEYGHVAIITDVTDSYVEVIQQNVFGKTRDRFPLLIENGHYYIGVTSKPAGWLRLE